MSTDVERISALFKNVDVSGGGSKRGNENKTFHLSPNVIHPHAHTGHGGTTSSLSGREGSPGLSTNNKNCKIHVPWKKSVSPSSSPVNGDENNGAKRGSSPGHAYEGLIFSKKDKELRKFSQDSIDLNEPVGNRHWERTASVIMEEENETNGNQGKPKFLAVTTIEDTQAIRCAEFHPRGHVYAVGSNSKTLRICAYPDTVNLSPNHVTLEPKTILRRNKHHRGSIYCLGWSPDGNLLATGSNDKTVKLTRFDETRNEFSNSQECELTMHDGTVRDICFIEDLSNKASLLVSGGAGDCKIYVTDVMTSTPFQAFTGHSAPILSLYNWGGVIFASGSVDKSIRLWDLRARGCVSLISPLTSPNSSTIKSAVGSVCVDPTGRLLISGHEDGAIVLFDIRGNRQIQSFKPHASDVKSVRFSPNAYYLLSAGYDQRLMLTDLQGDLSLSLNSVVVASHGERVISGRWHPNEFSFLSTSADKSATLWALPPSAP